jgi:threonylcarbamoyladenosine tRNA methylthiotransferase MtaB
MPASPGGALTPGTGSSPVFTSLEVTEERVAERDPAPASVAIDTHGCKLNQADSNLLARQFLEAGYRLVGSVAEADIYVLNTCTVTATADAKARQALNTARRANPRAFIVAAGCYPQRAAAELSRLDAVSLVVPNTDKQALVSLVSAARANRPPAPAVPLDNSPAPAPGFDLSQTPLAMAWGQRTRATIKIQEGCNQVCAYCIVPKVRGRERSIPPDTLVEQINRHGAVGYREVVLTGTQLGTYGFDIPGASLPGLLRRILKDTTVPRIRVSSLQPQEISRELLDLWADHRLCPHFHVPLQSGSDRILQSMRRRYTTEQFATAVALIRQAVPNAGVTTDLIVGFPGEDDARFGESRDFARSMCFSDMHVFPYSSRPGTSAAHLREQTPPMVKRERVGEILALAREGFREFRRRQLGTARAVLWESAKDADGTQAWSGLTDNYIRVCAHSRQDLRNTISTAELLSLVDDLVYSQPR